MIGLAGKALALRRWQSTCTSSSPAQGLLEWNNQAQFLQPSKHLSRPPPRKMPLKFPAKGIIGCHFSQILPIALCTRIRTDSSVVWARDQGRKPVHTHAPPHANIYTHQSLAHSHKHKRKRWPREDLHAILIAGTAPEKGGPKTV